MTNLNKKLIWTIVLGLVTVVIVGFFADFRDIIKALSGFNLTLLPIILFLTFINYFLRFVKWQFFLNQLEIKVPLKESFAIFLSGLAMSVTPGKVGEILKSLLLKEVRGVPVSRTAPIIFAERLSDGFGLLVLSLSGLLLFSYGKHVLTATAIVMLIILIVIKTPALYNPCIKLCSRLPLVGKFTGVFETLMESAGRLLELRALLFTVFLSIISWSFECVAFYLVFIGLGYKVSLLAATFVLAFSSIVGAVSMLPGGLGAAEGSILGLLVKVVGVPKNIAAVATILIRFCTLWFGVLVGMGALLSQKGWINIMKTISPRKEKQQG